MKGFIEFVRKQGVVGFAVGFILGGAVSKVVSAIVTDLVNPVAGLVLGSVSGLESASLSIGGAQILIGHLISALIDFIIVAAVVYFGVKGLGFEKLDRKEK